MTDPEPIGDYIIAALASTLGIAEEGVRARLRVERGEAA